MSDIFRKIRDDDDRRPRRMGSRVIARIVYAWIALWLVGIVGVGYVVIHFVIKFW